MEESGGRRIKRAIYIDQESICFVEKDLKEKLSKVSLLADHFKFKEKEIEKANALIGEETVNHRRLTNIGVFRAYLIEYLKSHEKINENLTLMVRQLAPNTSGLPIEIYAFTSSVEWTDYESVQSDIFDHILAIISLFDLKLTQSPSGHDIKNFLTNLNNNN